MVPPCLPDGLPEKEFKDFVESLCRANGRNPPSTTAFTEGASPLGWLHIEPNWTKVITHGTVGEFGLLATLRHSVRAIPGLHPPRFAVGWPTTPTLAYIAISAQLSAR